MLVCWLYYIFAKVSNKKRKMYEFRQLVAKSLREVADEIEVNTSYITESQAMDILRSLTHEAMSREQAWTYLNLSRSRFDTLVNEGKLPKGRKQSGFKELTWYKDELDAAIRKMRINKKK